MTKLKTLKELEHREDVGEGVYTIYEEELKQEAIKWVKVDNYYEFIKLFPFKILNSREMKVLKDFAKWQYNLTEEDLK